MVNILIVEDERVIAGLLKDILEIEGYQAVSLLNGEEAIQFMLRETPQLIILDIMLSGIDGYEVIRRLREHPKSMHIPIIALSTQCTSSDRARAFDLGVDSYVTKPFDPDELLACVRRQLSRLEQTSLSPLTRLPSGLQLERAIHYKVNSPEPWSILYLDLDNFKAFNDVYGFVAGNALIQLVGEICQRVVREYGNAEDFVGHVGGDDFIVLTMPERAMLICEHILTLYREESVGLYCHKDRERGAISGVDRKGQPYQFPLISLSIGIVHSHIHYTADVEEVGSLAAEAKRKAKQSTGNVFYISSSQGRAYSGYSHALRHVLSAASGQGCPHTSREDFPYSYEYERSHVLEDVLAEFK